MRTPYRRLKAIVAACAVALTLGGRAAAQTPVTQTPVTRTPVTQTPVTRTPVTQILAIGRVTPGAEAGRVQELLRSEIEATTRLYLEGKISQWYSLEAQRGVVFVLNMTDPQAAAATLETLPLGQAHLMRFELLPIGPLNPLRNLLAPASRSSRPAA